MSRAGWTTYHWLAAGMVLAVFGGVALIADLVFERVPHLEDEVAYLFQAQVFASGRAYVDSPAQQSCFFAPFVLDYEGRRFGKYSPGWPAVLAVGVWLGQPWWVNAAGAALTVALVFRLGQEAHGAQSGGLGAVLAATSPFLLLLSGSLMAHTWCAVFTTTFVWCAGRAGGLWPGDISGRPQPRLRWALAAGIAQGAAFSIRPFTAVAVAVPAGFCALWRLVQRREWKPLWFAGLGFVPPALSVPFFNAVWTGDPLLSPYVLFWPYDQLGFGPGHGVLEGGNTLWLGLGSAVVSIGQIANHLQGWPALSLTFVVLLFLFRPRRFKDLFLVGTALALVLGYVLYWTNGQVFGPRYTYEVSGPLYVLSGAGIVRVGQWMRTRRRWPRWGWQLLIALLLVVDLGVYLPWQFRSYRGLYGITGYPRRVLKSAGLHHALVIVREERGWWDYAAAFSMNEPTLDGDVVYASECPAQMEELLAEYAGREAYYFDGRSLWPLWTKGGFLKPRAGDPALTPDPRPS